MNKPGELLHENTSSLKSNRRIIWVQALHSATHWICSCSSKLIFYAVLVYLQSFDIFKHICFQFCWYRP